MFKNKFYICSNELIMKKLTFLLVLIVTNEMLFAQSYSQSTNFWNTVSMDNPAMSALSNRTEANLNINNINGLNRFSGNVIYNQQFSKIGGAIGVNTSYQRFGNFMELNRTMLNYNYQLQLNENRKLAFGAGIGYNRTAFFKEVYENSNFPFNRVSVLGVAQLGVAYHSDKFSSGISAVKSNLSSNRTVLSDINVFAEYRHVFGNNFMLSPKAMYSLTEGGYHDLNVALVGEFKNRFQLGIGSNNTTNPYLVVGYRLKSGLNFSYTLVGNRSKLNNSGISNYHHEFNIRFTLPTR